MARKTARPGRTLGVFFLGLAIAFGLVALGGSWKPELGLDLQGGTSIRLTPKGNPSAESLDEARKIIDQRVNGSGVTEAEVTVQGNKYIVVEIPGDSRRDLVDTVKRQAQLRFRVVACSDFNPGPCAGASTTTPQDPTAPDTGGTGAGVTAPATPTPGDTTAPSDGATPTDAGTPSGSANRAPVHYADGTDSPSPTESPTESPSDSTSAEPSEGATAPSDAGVPSGVPPTPAPEGGPDVAEPLKWIDAPNQEAIDAFNAFTCPQDGTPVNVEDDPKKPLVSCEWDSENKVATKYLLSAAMIEGTDLDNAQAAIPAERRQLRRTARLQRRRHQGVHRHLGGAGRHREAVRDRPRRPGDLGAHHGWPDHRRTTPDLGQLHPGQRQEPGHQPQVRRAAGVVLRLQRRDRRTLPRG